MDSVPKLVGNNFKFVRSHLGRSATKIAKQLNVKRSTFYYFELGRNKFLNETLAKEYYELLSKMPRFPHHLTYEKFLNEDLSEGFTDYDAELAADTHSSISVQELSNDIAPRPKSGEYSNGVSSGLKDFLNDKMEMAIANPSKEEIEILKKLHPAWRASKEFYRIALGDLRQNR